MWYYSADEKHALMCYAVSPDGVRWEKPAPWCHKWLMAGEVMIRAEKEEKEKWIGETSGA